MARKLLSCICLLIFFFSGCSSKPKLKQSFSPKAYRVYGKTYRPLSSSHAFVEEGFASWYGPKFHGKKTASGEIFNMYAYTAAHKVLPFQTKVRVTNLQNGKQVVVRINDRGPFVRGRIIDLSYQAAKALGMIGPGTARVRLEVVQGIQEKSFKGKFYIQVGAFAQKINALRAKTKAVSLGYKCRVVKKDSLWRVQVGPFLSLTSAKVNQQRLWNYFKNSFIFAD
ncbi:rare lipoprotein A [Desulfonauticus submarinus]|uniref:Probable endolytic peptidoglycan transglycosylase RlpA n=1 Tax=Desulfonauticus submarinus TaxID=206665 RepID=A0A1H0F7F6_9BACT|nr:septal ring lytic transglycosylase RlpA family protein [Desulfonauticus submarinus]SDN90536.1 rare lipoprotein A [Desulfonauticus submarinus]